MNTFTIKDLENLSGIKAHTIRIWEQRYNFIKPERTDTNIRHYSNTELKKILNISLLNKYGFKISHIDKINEGEVQEKILAITNTEAQQERLVNDLIHSMIEMDMEKLEQILDNYIISRGIERTIIQLIFPFLEKIGILWVTNHISPAQEHLVTNILRQKVIVGIEGINTPLKTNKKVLLFLPEGEYHELGLLFVNFLFKSKGAQVIYLGANISLEDVAYVAKLKSPDYLYCHLTAAAANFNFDKFLNSISKMFIGLPLIMSGQLTQSYQKKIPPHIIFKKSFAEVKEFITGL